MSDRVSIAFVAPPFGGHLFPQLELGAGLKERGDYRICFFSTPEASAAVELGKFEFQPVLATRSHEVMAISDTPKRVGSNPLRLFRQFRSNLALMAELKAELREAWTFDRPDLVVADFTVPIAGLLAREMGIRWWTSMPSPCAMETGDGTPTYLGGWMPPTSVIGRIRDSAGRKLIRVFKHGVHRIFRRELIALGVPRIYRDDGLEVIYSDEKILAMGMREFEFERSWPEQVEFIGPLTRSPAFDHEAPFFEDGKRHVLVSLGTHLWWAKHSARELVRAVADAMPDCVFHFSAGRHREEEEDRLPVIEGNFHCYRYLPYDHYLDRYAGAIHHGGTGVLYGCLQHAVPSLVWPQDYDQFDHAARLIHRGLGRRLRPRAQDIVKDLRAILEDAELAENLRSVQASIRMLDPIRAVARAIES